MNALQRLVRDRMAELGMRSYAELARRGGISRSTAHSAGTNDHWSRPPDRKTLEGLARGLQLPLGAVTKAAYEAAGWGYSGYAEREVEVGGERAKLRAAVDRITDEQVRIALSVVEALEREEDEQAQPQRQPR